MTVSHWTRERSIKPKKECEATHFLEADDDDDEMRWVVVRFGLSEVLQVSSASNYPRVQLQQQRVLVSVTGYSCGRGWFANPSRVQVVL